MPSTGRKFKDGIYEQLGRIGKALANGYYNLERMLRAVSNNGGEIGVCGNCMDARGITPDELPQGCTRGSLDQLAEWTRWADRTLVF